MYSESRGFYYEADLSSVRDAEDQLRKAKMDKQIYELEKQITSLEDAMKKETDAIDEQIKKLQEYSDEWGKVSTKLSNAMEDQRAAEILGRDWEKDILDQRKKTLEDFTKDYEELQKRQAEAYLNARRVEAGGVGTGGGGNGGGADDPNKTPPEEDLTPPEELEEAKSPYHYYIDGKEVDNATFTRETKRVKDLKDALSNEIAGLKVELNEAGKKNQIDKVKEISSKIAQKTAELNELNKKRFEIKSFPAKFTGTDSAAPGKTLVGELGSEIVLNKNGTATLVDEPTILNMKGGEKVFNAEETEKILKASKKGFSSLKDINPKKFALLNSFASGTSSAMQNAIATQAVGIASGIKSGLINTQLATTNGQVINNTFNVSLPNINDASKASELMKEFEHLFMKSTQYFNK